MNILILNSNNPLATSGIVSYDLFTGLKGRGHRVRLLVNSYSNDYPPDIISLETPFSVRRNKFIKRIKKRLFPSKGVRTNPDYHFHNLAEAKSVYRTAKILRKAGMNPDAVIVMFAGDFVNTKNIFELYRNTNARVFWLMYDMAPFTGGCHYAWDCNGYRERCGRCPGLYSDDPEDISNKNLLFKKKYIGKTGIEVIAASEWQFRQARSSYLFSDKLIHKILLSVDPELFAMADKNEARIRMGIPEGRKIIFFGSVYMSHRRKGMQYLLESLKILKEKVAGSLLDEKILLLIAGREMEEIESILAFPFHFLGFVNNTTGIASAFQAADLFLCPSIEDSGPSMINQSLMCGTPVVSFEMGVSPDLVKSGQTGYLARLKDSSDMAQGLYDVLSADDRTYERMAKNCRQLAIDLCSPEKQLDSIEKLLQTN